MMFPSAPAAPRGVPSGQAAPKKAEQPASGTIVFSQPSPRASPSAPAAGATLPGTKPPFPLRPEDEGGRSTMIFGASPENVARAPAPAAARPEQAKPAPSPALDAAAGEISDDVPPEDAVPPPGPFDKAPPRGLLIGVAAGLALLLAIGGTLVAYRKLARNPPAPAAVEMLAAAQSDAALDTLASIAAAEAKARDALDVAGPRARFAEGTATLARIEIQWADALNDEATRIADTSADDPKVAQLKGDAKSRLKVAFELLSPAVKADKDAPELQLALADYYRAQRSPSNLNRSLKRFKEDPRAALIQGMALLEEDEGAERAIPRLQAAAAADPRSARVRYQLALAYALAHDEPRARAEIEETLRLSPQHERAQALRQRVGKPGAAEKK
jgi:hypothetical protein